MSNLFSCFACNERRKRHKYGDDTEDDKLPKEKRLKKGKGKKQKGGNDMYIPLNNQIVIHTKDHNPINSKDKKHSEIHAGDHNSLAIKMANNDGAGDVSERSHLNDFVMKDSRGKDGNHQVPQVHVNGRGNARSNSISSEGSSSDARSCLTDSDLNISEAVFIAEEGPRVGSLGASLSRMGLQSMRATMENERRLEKELLDRVSVGSWNKKINHNLNLSIEGGKISKEERNY